MKLFDSHCHLDTPEIFQDLDAVFSRAQAAGVAKMCTIGVGDGTTRAKVALQLATQYPEKVCATIGVHPHDAAEMTQAHFDEFVALSSQREVAAIGEIGLDYFYDQSPREKQREVFARFLQLAAQCKKSVTIHTRDADQDTFDLLQSENAKALGGVIHCFSHSYEFGKAALELGFYLSIPGVITFKKSEALRDAVKKLPLDRMMIETDSPYLAPVPMRGKPNEPSFVAHTAKFLAELKGVSLEEVAEKTTTNACALYRVTCG
jgi:TatD DNase family protein